MTVEKSGEKIVILLAREGRQAFFVGGIVRNRFIKRISDNVDIATDATPDQVEAILSKENIKVKPVGKKFGSILAIVDNVPVEITTFRIEGRYSDNRHPDQVEFIKDYLNDAKRRDFTVNALYYDPVKKKLFDPTNGMKDLKGKLLRFVGDPKKRIDEDALRMMRGVRLATQLGFKLEKNSFAAIKTRAKYIQDISGERVKAELDKILISENRIEGLRLLDKIGLMKFIIPELELLKRMDHGSRRYHLEGNIFEHTLLAAASLRTENLDLVYGTLFHDLGKAYTRERKNKNKEWVYSYHGHSQSSLEIFKVFADKYKFPRKNCNMILSLIKDHDLWVGWPRLDQKNKVKIAFQKNIGLLVWVWRADIMGNLRQQADGKVVPDRPEQFFEAQKILIQIKKSQTMIQNLANGELIMKYSKLKPGRQLGEKIADVKVQIVLSKIKNEKDLEKYLK